ncbi:MAG: ral nucleoside transport system permease protein [Clostridia bacterium]|nr:ral nucleoside transport system permease protein [Clostridia bacterium]
MPIVEVIFSIEVLVAGIRMTTPLLLASLGGLLASQCGVFNIGLEGLMLVGSFSAIVFDYLFNSWVLGVLGGILFSSLLALVFAFFVVDLRADEIVAGVAINVLGLGATTYLLRTLFGVKGAFSSPRIQGIPVLNIPGIDRLPVIGALLSGDSVLVYFSWLLVVALAIFLYRTPLGLYIRAAGQNKEALAAAGISVRRVRYISLVLNGALCGLGGAYLSIGYLSQFVENMTAGRGFIAIAAVVFGEGDPFRVFIASLLFGLVDSLSIRFQSLNIPSYFALMLPYIITTIVLAMTTYRKMKGKRRVQSADSY